MRIMKRDNPELFAFLHEKLNGRQVWFGTYLVRDPETYKKIYESENTDLAKHQARWEEDRKARPYLGPWPGPYPPDCLGHINSLESQHVHPEDECLRLEMLADVQKVCPGHITISDRAVFLVLVCLIVCATDAQEVSDYMVISDEDKFVLIMWPEGSEAPTEFLGVFSSASSS